MSTRQTFTQKAEELLGGLTPGLSGLTTFVDQARAKVDKAKPLISRNAISGDGSDEYTLPSPWLQYFSVIDSVYILDSDGTDEQSDPLQPEQYRVEQNASGADQIRLLDTAPGSTDTVVVFHTSRHTVDDTSSTILGPDEEAFAELVATLALRLTLSNALGQHDQRTDTDRASVDIAHVEQLREMFREFKASSYAHFGIRADVASIQQATPRHSIRSADRSLKNGTIRQQRHTHPSGTS